MKYFDWNESKNEKLKKERGISFEDIVIAVQENRVLEVVRNKKPRYSHQDIFIVNIANYAYVVPFVEDETKVFFKTIYPSRKYTKLYLEKRNI